VNRLAVEASYLPDTFSSSSEKDRLYDPDGQENVLFAAWKRIVSGCARNAPFLPLNYRDARTVMIQNANGIKSNDTFLAGGNCHSGQEDLSILVADDVMTHLLRKGSDV
jgi:hypothetical protein